MFRVLVPDNASAIVAAADAVNPRFTAGWLDYAQARGFVTDAARVRSPEGQAEGRAGRAVRARELLRRRALRRAVRRAGPGRRLVPGRGRDAHPRHHRRARPAEVFAEREAAALLPAPQAPYDVPVFARVKVHRDFHVEVGRALYSAPRE